jgi:D-alanyl-D-alanine carboxypeptidase
MSGTRKTARLVPILALAACSGSADPEPIFEAHHPLPWVNPSRCLSPCTHEAPVDLVAVDGSAQLADAGAFRVAGPAQPALAMMLVDGAREGHALGITSAYRTYAEQATLYDQLNVTDPGRAARPGHSEHEAGLAIDLGLPDIGAPEWVATNMARYGFVLSYPKGKEKVTGFQYESWHVRFVGTEVAKEVERSRTTLEEYFEQHPDVATWGDCTDCPLPSSRSDCAAVSEQGTCAGTLLQWCMQGASAAVNCASSGLTCGASLPDGSMACIDPSLHD